MKLHYYKKNQADASSMGSALPADFYRKQNRLAKLLASQDQVDRDNLNKMYKLVKLLNQHKVDYRQLN